MSRSTSITTWNVLALMVVLIGGGATLLMAHQTVRDWAYSGIRIPVGDWYDVDLPAGDVLVYYESAVSLPTANVELTLRDRRGQYIGSHHPDNANEFKLISADWAGRSLWELSIPESDTYTAQAVNYNISREDEDRSGDSIVFAKQPTALSDAMRRRNTTLAVGAAVTIVLAAALYVVHGFSLRHDRSAE